MPYRTLDAVRDDGFQGFQTVSQLRATALLDVPTERGVYLILRDVSKFQVFFLTMNSGGHFKGREPTVEREKLQKKWVTDSVVLYVGKAEGTNSKTGQAVRGHLRSRLADYMSFGLGRPVGHWGGRYIWQLADADQLLVAWKPTPTNEPVKVEQQIIDDFHCVFGKYPFANCRR